MISLPKQLVVIGDSSVLDGEIMKVADGVRGLEKIGAITKMDQLFINLALGEMGLKKFPLDGKKNGHLEEKREEINLKQSCLMLVLTTLQQLVR